MQLKDKTKPYLITRTENWPYSAFHDKLAPSLAIFAREPLIWNVEIEINAFIYKKFYSLEGIGNMHAYPIINGK